MYNVPIEIVDGFIGSISVTIPWSALLSDNTVMEINNLELTIQPKQRNDNGGHLLIFLLFKITNNYICASLNYILLLLQFSYQNDG